MDIAKIEKCMKDMERIESLTCDLQMCNNKELIRKGLNLIYDIAQETDELLDYCKNEKIKTGVLKGE